MVLLIRSIDHSLMDRLKDYNNQSLERNLFKGNLNIKTSIASILYCIIDVKVGPPEEENITL